MKRILPLLAKRCLAFTLSLVLLLSLCPVVALPANAAVHSGEWTYESGYEWIKGSFQYRDVDLVYENDQAYYWGVYITPTKDPPSSAQVVASITDEKGNLVSSYKATVSGLDQYKESLLCSYANFPELTTDLFGVFTLTFELQLYGTTYAKLVQTFSRVSSVSVESSISSRSKPSLIFTVADPIDLVLNIKKTDGIAESFNAAVTITSSNDNELLAARGVSLPAATNLPLSLKDLVDIAAIDEPGNYSVNLILTDTSGTIKHQSSTPFTVVSLNSSIACTITSVSSSNMAFVDDQAIDLTVQLKKDDGIAESVTALTTITNSAGSVLFRQSKALSVPGIGTIAFTPNLSGLTAIGDFRLNVVLTDSAGNERGSASASFSRISTASMTATLTNPNPKDGLIYLNSDTLKLKLDIQDTDRAGESLLVRYNIFVDGNMLASKETSTTLKSDGTRTLYLSTSNMVCYGKNDIQVNICDANGTVLRTLEYSFTRVLSTANPGDMSLLNVNEHFTNYTGDPAIKLRLSAKAGAAMWRSSISWASVETSKGNYALPEDVENVMSITTQYGMEPLIILAYNNGLYGSANPDNPTWVNAYANYCYYVANALGDSVTYYEIWNEWNADMGKVPEKYRGGDYYAKVLVAASEAIKRANPNAKIIGGSLAGDTSAGATAFIRSMLSYPGAMDAIDGFSFHTYATDWKTTFYSPTQHNYPSRFNHVISLINEYGDASTKEIWMTETGWSTAEVVGVTEEEQAAYLVQLYAWSLAHPDKVDRLFWYDVMNDRGTDLDWDPAAGEQNWGLIHSWTNTGNEPAPYSAKKSYPAMCAFSSTLAGATYKDTVSLGSGIEAYSFTTGDGQAMVVAWTTSDITKTLNCSGSMTVTDMYGNATGNLTSTTLSECPIYIVCDSGTLSVG